MPYIFYQERIGFAYYPYQHLVTISWRKNCAALTGCPLAPIITTPARWEGAFR